MKTIEICAGAGGQALGLHNAGAEHIALVENDADACATLRLNNTKNRLDWGKIYEKDLKVFVEQNADKYVGEIDLIAGGVPCPPFSKAGFKLGPEDERDLFPVAIELIEKIQPKAVMLENVDGLLGSEFQEYRENLKNKLKCLGYSAEWKSIQASDFGVSQKRSRAILVSFKTPYRRHFLWPKPNFQGTKTIGELLFDLIASKGWRHAGDWKQKANGIAPTIVGGSKKHGGPDLGPTRAKREWQSLYVNGHRLANEDEIPDQNFKNYKLRNGTIREGFDYMPMLTVRMVARIQGFPDFWSFSGGKTAAYRQVGNAFPSPVAEAIGKQISKAIVMGDQNLSVKFQAAE
ncbi:DNA cytosine methyltransferase [Kiloniella sp. EL199]|uniref:DNA cytosine methyltransferase n=1 Tax=Kiloniella sp. EL199 TaxID=2107581 RepID=UPI000EA038CF|nr:DNA cytosine methyltransferase [Kiloniella sp. EL199]